VTNRFNRAQSAVAQISVLIKCACAVPMVFKLFRISMTSDIPLAILGENNYQARQGLRGGMKNTFRTVLTISNKNLK
jgi:hypothetical protein